MPDLRRSGRLQSTAHYPRCDPEIAPRNKRKALDDVPVYKTDPPAPKRLRLTKENLTKIQRLNKHSGDQDTMDRARKTPSSASESTVTTTDKQFAAKLVENGIVYEVFDAEAPDDVDQIKTALLKVRELPPLAQRNWAKIREAKRNMAQSESSLESMIVESMLYHHDSPSNYLRYRNDQWTEVENELTAGISDPKPDVTEAHVWSAYPPGTREDIQELSPSQYGYAMPTFAMESKGPNGDHEQAVKQAAYDGAVMTHAALAIEGLIGKKSLIRKTKAITITLSPVEINVYANHAVLAKAGRRSYHQYRVIKVQYLDSEEEWNRAHTVVSNAQELAMGFAKSRVKAVWDHFRKEQVKQKQIKARGAQLRIEALAKTKAVTAPGSVGQVKTKPKNSNPRDGPQMEAKAAITPPSSKHDT